MMSEQAEWMDRRGFIPVHNPYSGGYASGFDPGASYQFMSESWDEPRVFKLADQSPYFNVWGLHYRPLGGDQAE